MKLRTLLILLALYCFGCKESYKPELYTDLGIGVITNGYTPDLELIDQMYLDTLECAGIDDTKQYLDKFIVYIKDDKPWRCGDMSGKIMNCTGQYGYYYSPHKLLQVLESLSAFPHELGHMLDHYKWGIGGMWTHNKCSTATNCGNRVGSYYNSGRYLKPEEEENWEPHPTCLCAPDPEIKGYPTIVDEDGDGVCDSPKDEKTPRH